MHVRGLPPEGEVYLDCWREASAFHDSDGFSNILSLPLFLFFFPFRPTEAIGTLWPLSRADGGVICEMRQDPAAWKKETEANIMGIN